MMERNAIINLNLQKKNIKPFFFLILNNIQHYFKTTFIENFLIFSAYFFKFNYHC